MARRPGPHRTYDGSVSDLDPRAKYRTLPTSIDPADTVEGLDTGLAAVEEPGRDYNNGAEPYLRSMGWRG